MPLHQNYVLHGGDYSPEQWRNYPEIIEEDFKLMRKASYNTVTLGMFAWSDLEPMEGVFDFQWLDDIVERCRQNHVNILMGTPSAARPLWLQKKYPETTRIPYDCAFPSPLGGRANHCWSSPVLHEKLKIIIAKIAERYGNHPALIGWHIGNEHAGFCCCERCLAKFREWLARRYQSLENLNAAYWSSHWGHHVAAWEDLNPFDESTDLGLLDYSRFMTETIADFIRFEASIVRRHSQAPITTNMMGLYPYLDYWKIADICDFVSDDSYPTWYTGEAAKSAVECSMIHSMHYCMKQKPFVIMECCPGVPNYKPYSKMRRPGEFEREMLLALGHGADGTLYFQWRKSRGNCEKIHGAVVGHDGGNQSLTFKRVSAYGQKLAGITEIVGAVRQAPIALVVDPESNWALKTSYGFNSRWKDTSRLHLEETAEAHYGALWKQHVNIDVINEDTDLSAYRLVVLPMVYMFKHDFAERLTRYLEQGGTAVMTFLTGYVDENNLCFLGGNPGGTEFRRFCGLWNEDIDLFDPATVQTIKLLTHNDGKREFKVLRRCEYCHAEGADTLAVYGHDFMEGTPALLRKTCGKGALYYLAADTEDDFLDLFYGDLLPELSIQPLWLHGLPSEVRIASRLGVHDDIYYFLYNLSTSAVAVTPPMPVEDIWLGQQSGPHIILPPNGGTVLKGLLSDTTSGHLPSNAHMPFAL